MSEVERVSPVAGWYPDPSTGHQRWWDGAAWRQFAPANQVVQVRAQKESGIAYIFFIFLGGFGAHHFYVGNVGVGVTQLILTVLGWSLSPFGIGFFLLVPLWIWLLVDLFAIPGYVRTANARSVPGH